MIATSNNISEEISNNGFAIIENIYTEEEVLQIINAIEEADSFNPTFRRSTDLFAIRQFFKEVPKAVATVFNKKLTDLTAEFFGNDFFVVKSIYFDKPAASNWFVSYHQDLTISVDTKLAVHGFGPWTVKQDQFAVQPPLKILEDNFTIRIHLDDTDENNGALKVVPQSHCKGIYRPETIDWTTEKENICQVKRGGIMIMRPLLLHSSGRTVNNKKRRVIHIECSSSELPTGLNWSEFLLIN
ncbi:phytanoyl-CoA dioxygenase family protein [Ferruginibacter sp. SUN106]|uniref:phytanoyl-CoA dioxygenase family protein n=1 Tax=Ferruginibacter sp. SUN106 TaxID=2978348 RepID=UPI003D36992A